MQVNYKATHLDAVEPKYAHIGDAGMDLTAVSKSYDKDGNTVYGTGLAFEVPAGHVMFLFPRSSNSRTDLRLTNSVGVIDSTYRGEVYFKYRTEWYNRILRSINRLFKLVQIFDLKEYNVGDRIGQFVILPFPTIELVEKTSLTDSLRGSNGYGSTGR